METELPARGMRSTASNGCHGHHDAGAHGEAPKDIGGAAEATLPQRRMAHSGSKVEVSGLESQGSEIATHREGSDTSFRADGHGGADHQTHSPARTEETYQTDTVIMLLTLSLRPEAHSLHSMSVSLN